MTELLGLDNPESLDVDLRRQHVAGVCPFCGGRFFAGWRRSKPDTATLLHNLPHCETFAGLQGQGLNFLHAAKRAGAEMGRLR